MTASGTAGHGAELAPLPRPRRAGRGGREVAVGRPVGREPRAAGARDRRRDAQQRRAPGPGVAAWLADDLPALLDAGRPGGGVRSGAAPSRTTPGPADAPGRRPGRGRGRRGQPVVPEHRGRPGPVRPLRRGHRRGDGRHRGVRPAPLGQAQPERHRARRRSPPPPRPAGPRPSPSSTPCMGMAIDPETGAVPARARRSGGRALGRGDPPVAVRAVHDVHAALPGPARSSGWAAWAPGADAAELLLAGASAVQVGTATFADPRAPRRVLDELEAWADRTDRRPHGRPIVGAPTGGTTA